MREATLVADSSPLIGLARIGQLELLPRLAERVLVPPAVWHEAALDSRDSPGAVEIRRAPWLIIEAPERSRVEPLKILVDRGEAEAIALARGTEGSLLLIDDSRARRVAKRLELRHVGTVGLLRRAKKEGLVAAVKPLLEALVENGIFIEQALIDAVLADLEE